MAWAHCALSHLLPPPSKTVIFRKTLASLSSPSPSKFKKRKNYLRQKLLKTLTKPHHTPILPQENPVDLSEALEFPQEGERDISSDRNRGEFYGNRAEELEENEELTELGSPELHVLETANSGLSDTPNVVFTRSMLELLLYGVGFFVFQTVCAVWIFGSDGFNKKNSNGEGEAELGVLDSEMFNGKAKDSFWLSFSKVFGGIFRSNRRGVVYVDKSQFEEKIVEVRAMAREARESEAKKLKANDQVSSSDVIDVDGNETVRKTVNSRIKTNIQKEVDGRLSKLEKSLRLLRMKSPTLAVSYLNNSDKVEDKKTMRHSDTKLKAEKFVFKKKLKFRNSQDKPGTNPKGFPSAKDHSKFNGNSITVAQDVSFSSGSDGNVVSDLSAQEKLIDLPNVDSQESVITKEEDSHWLTNDASEESVSSIWEKKEETREISRNEWSPFHECGRNLDKEREPISGGIQESRELVEPRASNKLKTKISQSFTKQVEHKPMVKNLRDKRVDTENDLWWTNLPFALAVLLRRGSDSDGPRGLYSLKMDEDSSSYTVAFEDRHDASYFCYILESFFEDLGDFSADIVPLSIEELQETVKSGTTKIMVVRKGQIRLYAGQPLADVEMALRSFIQ